MGGYCGQKNEQGRLQRGVCIHKHTSTNANRVHKQSEARANTHKLKHMYTGTRLKRLETWIMTKAGFTWTSLTVCVCVCVCELCACVCVCVNCVRVCVCVSTVCVCVCVCVTVRETDCVTACLFHTHQLFVTGWHVTWLPRWRQMTSAKHNNNILLWSGHWQTDLL